MTLIRYNLCTRVNCGTEEKPSWNDVLYPVSMPWSESNEEIAKAEAYKGEYTIEDDGQPEPEKPSSDDSAVWDELDAAYQEGVDSV